MSSAGTGQKNSDIVVFQIVRDSSCAECGLELGKGRWLRLEGERPLCMSCADLAHLVFLPAGSAALTRRASKHSKLRAVLVHFSRTRKRYERQGILVEEAALVRAEQECLADEEARARARERRAEREAELDKQYRDEFAQRVGSLYPGCPPAEAMALADHACRKYSGRVGRTAAAKEFSPEAIDLAVRAHVRHAHTRYDELLGTGWERHEARAAVREEMESLMNRWRSSKNED
jgi:hypothetical protein